MTEINNQAVVVRSRPSNIPQAENFQIETRSIPALENQQILVKNQWLSVDPAMRGWLADADNYLSVPAGDVMRSLAVGTIIASKHTDFPEGTQVMGWFGWQTHAVVDTSAIVQTITASDIPASLYLGGLGLNGITAATALDKVGQPQPGDTVVVSTAAGGVGSCVGQLAKMQGCRTVGITSSPEKMQQCKDTFGYDEVLSYREPNLSARVAQACPDGVNVYFDNTSGAISDAIMPHLALHARVVVCGTAAISSWDPVPTGPRVERILLTRRARMQGFILFDHMDTYPDYVRQLEEAIRQGKLHYREDVSQGLETAPGAIAQLYSSQNTGKRLIQLPD